MKDRTQHSLQTNACGEVLYINDTYFLSQFEKQVVKLIYKGSYYN